MPPIQYSDTSSESTGQVKTGNNTVTIRTTVPGRATSAAATGFPLKLEQVQNVNTKHGIPDNAILKYNKTTGMWEPETYQPSVGSPVITKRFNFVDSLEWVVQHDMGTTAFRETLVNADGSKFTARTRILDINSFVVYLTSAESGWVDVIFNI